MNVLELIMLHNNGNVDKKFQPSILNKSRENHGHTSGIIE